MSSPVLRTRMSRQVIGDGGRPPTPNVSGGPPGALLRTAYGLVMMCLAGIANISPMAGKDVACMQFAWAFCHLSRPSGARGIRHRLWLFAGATLSHPAPSSPTRGLLGT